MLYTSLVIVLIVGAAVGVPETTRNDQVTHDRLEAAQDPAQPDLVVQMEKRSPHYNFGLGKRAYSYVSEYKRLPVYNFGLGKRSRPYSFGLGKRSVDEGQTDEYPGDGNQDQGTYDVFDQYDDAPVYEVKRARPYSFGLGKRLSQDGDVEEKRARTYDFGLGKRPYLYNFGLGKRARNYNFGLGKRLASKFNFGLGKRERDLHRFSFGLGKRSVDTTYDENDNYIDV